MAKNMAEAKILVEGYTNADSLNNSGEEKTCPTVSLVLDKDIVMLVDPGVLDSQVILADALEKENIRIEDVNFVCITHSHIDHYRNIGMFPDAKTIEYFGIWSGGRAEDLPEQLTGDIRIIKTPGHDSTSITLLVKTGKGIVAVCGDVFWKENGPETDAYAQDQKELVKSREKVLKSADWIIPGHGPMFKVRK
jgi:glyoxylase-like metal-dependent hydrolase (beta-lactamase superfamily II)